MALFEKAITVVLKHEGGFVNNPNDNGGITNFGITLKFLKDYPLIGDFDNDGDVDAQDIRNMTLDQAKMVYKKCWWDKYKYGMINDQTIATKVFDFSVNMGSKRAHILLQQAINDAFDLNLDCDGIIGMATLSVINSIHDGGEEKMLLDAYSVAAWNFYQGLANKNSKLKVFLKGWKNRAFDLIEANEIE